MTRSARLLIVGPPGAGKGTQATRIAEQLSIPAISTGDIFRQNIKDQTDLGKRVSQLINAGELVPDELTNEIVADRLGQSDAEHGFLLDGYPRTVEQATALDQHLASREVQLDAVILLEADTEAVISRLLKRAQLEGRADDTEEVIRHRQEVYAQQTEPLIDLYGRRGIVLRIDGMGTVDEVAARIEEALNGKLGER